MCWCWARSWALQKEPVGARRCSVEGVCDGVWSESAAPRVDYQHSDGNEKKQHESADIGCEVPAQAKAKVPDKCISVEGGDEGELGQRKVAQWGQSEAAQPESTANGRDDRSKDECIELEI